MEKLYAVNKNKTRIQTEIEESGENHENIQVWPKSNPLWLYSGSDK